MTEMDIIKALARWMDRRKYPFQLPNLFIYGWECDYWAMTKDGETREFEIKISRSDYFCDSKKQKHNSGDKGANFFYYVVPEGLISVTEVPKKYGLISVAHDGVIRILKTPKRLNNNVFDKWKPLAIKMYWRFTTVWREMYMNEKISVDEFRDGFKLDTL